MNMRIAIALLLTLTPVFSEGISRQEYQSRRAELRKSLDGVMVLFGATEPDDLRLPYLQETNFLYLSGWRDPGAVMMLTPKEDILFLPPRDLRLENFTGRKVGADDADAPQKTGFEKVLPYSAIESTFLRLLESSTNVYATISDPRSEKLTR